MARPIEDVFEDKAREGEGQYAIAFALLQIARHHERLVSKVGQLGFDAPGGGPGAVEFIGMQLRDIAQNLECLTVSASVDVSNA